MYIKIDKKEYPKIQELGKTFSYDKIAKDYKVHEMTIRRICGLNLKPKPFWKFW